MASVWIWVGALLVYAGFRLWYDSWRGPLTDHEVDTYMARLQSRTAMDPARLAALREFLESDDGSEFFMVNLIATHSDSVAMPGTGEKKPADEVLKGYTDHFMPSLFRRAGHPAFAGPAAGGNVEQWGVEKLPAWTFSGVIRYRSRRDMIELATNPKFEPAHAYKIAAMASTFAFPAKARIWVGPRVWVGLAIGLVVAVGHLAIAGS